VHAPGRSRLAVLLAGSPTSDDRRSLPVQKLFQYENGDTRGWGQICHFHYLREAAQPISEADRHAKKEVKKRVRGIRKIERAAEKKAEGGEDDAEAEIVRGYGAAVRAAFSDDGLPPLAA
jgi:hypothetical protein